MTNVILGVDLNDYADDAQTLQYIAGLLEKAGFSVQTTGVGPNPTQEYCMEQAKGDEVCVLMCNGIAPVTFADFGTGVGTYYHITRFIEAGQGWIQGPGWCDDMKNKPCDEHDFNGPASFKAKWNLKTLDEVADAFGRDKLDWCCANTKEDLANAIIACLNGTPLSTGAAEGGSGVYWPDKTFWGLIRQITGAVDAVFIIANNMAYMLSFRDFYKYRDRYEEFIPELPATNILNDSIEKNWTTSGFYNTVVIDYGTAVAEMYGQEIDTSEKEITTSIGTTITRPQTGGRIQYEYEPLVKQYGRQPFFYEFPDDDEETAKAKANALLAAHIRDYSLDIFLTCIYDKQITVGSWLKVPKKITQINYERVIPTVEGAKETKDNPYKEGEEVSKKTAEETSTNSDVEYDLLYVQGYSVRWDTDHSLIMDLHLKYAPDTPEDPVNATVGSGGAISTGQGNFGNDCFTIADICVANNEKILPRYLGGARKEEVKSLINGEHQPDSEDMTPRASQNSTYAKDYAGMTLEEAYVKFRNDYDYNMYCDNCDCWSCASDFYDNAGKGANCGDTACLLKVIFDSIGVTTAGVHIDNHFFTCVQINGTWETVDGTRGPANCTISLSDGSYGSTNCPCDSYPTGGNCSCP